MAHVVFYEKPGCIGNARQKKLLKRSGHRLEVRDMIAAPWTPEALRPFFGDRPVRDWFNQSAPRVKSGEVPADRLDADAALAAMCADPVLIRRPLLEVGARREAGFETDRIAAWIGLVDENADIGEGCPRETAKRAAQENDDEDKREDDATVRTDHVRPWADAARLEPAEIDCAIAVMLKILDGKCKMNAVEKVVMEALYDAVKHRPAHRLGPDDHALIATARNDGDDALVDQIYERRVLAETRISRPVMKAFKARLRAEGVLAAKR